MKKSISILSILLLGLFLLNFSTATAAIEIPDNVQQVVDKSCYACHNTTSTDNKAKKKFDFDKLNFMKNDKAIAEWDKVATVVIDGEMPPKKFNKKYPDKQLSRNDKQVLTNWINGLSKNTEISLESQMNGLVDQIVSSLAQNDKSKIAVLDFVNMNGEITKLGRYMSEELTTRLYLTGKFEVIERKLLDKIVEEQKISLSGMVDESTAAELGKVLGVDAIASGTITDLGTSVKVNARLISAESGKLFSVASVEIPKNDKVKVLLTGSLASSGSTSSSSGSAAKKTEPAATKNPVITRGSYKYELLGIRVEGDYIYSRVKLTNPGNTDKEFSLWGWEQEFSKVFDDLGNEYYLVSAKYASKDCDPQLRYCLKKMVAGTSMIMELGFWNDGINPNNATKITLLELIGLEGYFTGFRFEVRFRNIPLKKD